MVDIMWFEGLLPGFTSFVFLCAFALDAMHVGHLALGVEVPNTSARTLSCNH